MSCTKAGRFLWVAFQIQNICTQLSDEDIALTLDNLPSNLPEVYERILLRLALSKKADLKVARKLFLWLAAAKCPLDLGELREAISVEPHQREWSSARLVNDMTRALSCCGSLVTVEEEDSTVHFAHHSIKQFLLSDNTSDVLQDYHFTTPIANTEASEICMTYLTITQPRKQAAKVHNPVNSLLNNPSTLLRNALPSKDGTTTKIALKLLRDKSNTKYSLSQQLQETAGDTKNRRLRQLQNNFHFLPYVQHYWLSHTSSLMPQNGRMWALWCHLIEDDTDCIRKPWTAL